MSPSPTRARALFVSWLNHETVKNLIGNNSSGVTDRQKSSFLQEHKCDSGGGLELPVGGDLVKKHMQIIEGPLKPELKKGPFSSYFFRGRFFSVSLNGS